MTDQPPPQPGTTPIFPLVIADLQAREAKGIATYGRSLESWNGRDALWDAYEEALDLAVYLRQVIEERQSARYVADLEREVQVWRARYRETSKPREYVSPRCWWEFWK